MLPAPALAALALVQAVLRSPRRPSPLPSATEDRMRQLALLLRGTVIRPALPTKVQVMHDTVLGVGTNGRILFIEEGHTAPLGDSLKLRHDKESFDLTDVRVVELNASSFLVPGLIDTHTHAPQFTFAGTGYDLQLLQWLETYTFKFEAQFTDLEHARRVYSNVVRRTLSLGSTTCVYFATIHTDASLLLANAAAAAGQRAFVGKVNMDRNSPAHYVEETSASLAETGRFLSLMPHALDASAHAAIADGAPTPVPIITPRFVPTCSSELMHGLGKLAEEHDLLVQTHISENKDEVAWVKELHPDCDSYAATYDAHGLLRRGTLLAHGVYLTMPELELIKAKGAAVAHCPMSNSMLRSGAMPVRTLLNANVSVALGTDVSGGASPSMLCAIREAIKVSNLVSVHSAAAAKAAYATASTTAASTTAASTTASAISSPIASTTASANASSLSLADAHPTGNDSGSEFSIESPKKTTTNTTTTATTATNTTNTPAKQPQPDAKPKTRPDTTDAADIPAHLPALSSSEAFYLATVGGARALGVEGLTGDLTVGSVFDALHIDAGSAGSAFDLYGHEKAVDMFEKWLQLGDDRNVAAVYVNGRKVR